MERCQRPWLTDKSKLQNNVYSIVAQASYVQKIYVYMQMYKKIWKRYKLNSDYLSEGMLDWKDGGVKRNFYFVEFYNVYSFV